MFLTSAVITVLIYSGSYDFCDVSDDTGDEGTEDSQLSLTRQFTSALEHVLSSFRSCFYLTYFVSETSR